MSERWPNAFLFLLLLGHLFLHSTHEQAEGNHLEAVLIAALGPGIRASAAVADAGRDVVDSVRFASSLRRENAELRHEVGDLRREIARLHGVEEKLERLSRIAAYERPDAGETFVADVVHLDPASWLRTLVIYTGTAVPQRNQPVFSDQGLVGRVVVPAGRYAKVLLVTDRSLSVSAMLARTRQRGVVRGDGEGRLRFDHIPIQADVRLDDLVVTAGIDGVFPRGIPIGKVSALGPGEGLFHRIEVVPAVDLGRLEQVYVITQPAVPAEIRRTPSARELTAMLAEAVPAETLPAETLPAQSGETPAEARSGVAPEDAE